MESSVPTISTRILEKGTHPTFSTLHQLGVDRLPSLATLVSPSAPTLKPPKMRPARAYSQTMQRSYPHQPHQPPKNHTMRNLFLSLSVATMAISAGCLSYGISEMTNLDKSTRSISNSQAANLFLGGFVGAHLAVAPLMVASRID